MQIVIEIDEKEMEMVKNSNKAVFIDVYKMMAQKIQNGTILPKGHGKLKDADELLENAYQVYDGVRHMWTPDFVINADDIDSAPTILDAEGEA